MAVNSSSRQFRKVDVDQYDEERFQDDTAEDTSVSGPNEGEVSNLLSQNRNAEALKLVLSNPPVNSKNQKLKDQNASLVLRVLSAFKVSEMEAAVNQLDSQSLDVLMKYVYRGFEVPKEAVNANLLAWHDKVFAIGGHGCIVRVLTDRKRV